MITPYYIAVEQFSPSWGKTWTDFIKFSGLTQIEEIVSLDDLLCPPVISLDEKDWDHNVDDEYMYDFFRDLDYLEKRIEGISSVNILAAVRNPQVECKEAFSDCRFRFKGYDLVERGMGISALVNCAGFPLSFQNRELSVVGLVSELSRALEIQASLLKHYPEEHHADCDIWALWRKE